MNEGLEHILQGQPITREEIQDTGLDYSCTFGRDMPLYTDQHKHIYAFERHDEEQYRLFMYIENGA